MEIDVTELEGELLPSIDSLAMILLGVALASSVLTELHLFPDRNAFLIISIAFYPLAALIWLLGKWRVKAGYWAAVLGVMGIIALGTLLVDVNSFAYFLTIPVVMAAILLRDQATILVAIVESILLVGLSMAGVFGEQPNSLFLALLSIWIVWAILFAIRNPQRKRLEWFWAHYLSAKEMLDEAQQDRAHLAQVLDDLSAANRQLNLLNERLDAMYTMFRSK